MTLLPSNASQLERDLESSQARAFEIPVDIRKVWRPDECPAHLLPWLAWALSVDEWDSDWDTEKKREVVAASIAIHRKKGTVHAVKRALVLADAPDAVLKEWWEFGGEPRTFQVHLNEGHVAVSTAKRQQNLLKLVFSAKPVAAHLSEVRISCVWSMFPDADLKMAVAGVGGDARPQKMEFKTDWLLEQALLVLFAQADQRGLPIPDYAIAQECALNSFVAMLPEQFSVHKLNSDRKVKVFKQLPEGEMSPGHVVFHQSANHAHIAGFGTFGLDSRMQAMLVFADLPIEKSFSLNVIASSNRPLSSHVGAATDCLLPQLFSSNAIHTRPEKSAVYVFRGQIPDGDLDAGQVFYSVMAQDAIYGKILSLLSAKDDKKPSAVISEISTFIKSQNTEPSVRANPIVNVFRGQIPDGEISAGEIVVKNHFLAGASAKFKTHLESKTLPKSLNTPLQKLVIASFSSNTPPHKPIESARVYAFRSPL